MGSAFPGCLFCRNRWGLISDNVKNRLDEWVYFLKNREIKDGFTAKGLKEAREKLKIGDLTDEEYLTYKRYLENMSYEAGPAQTIRFDREYAEGIGFQKGYMEGIEMSKTDVDWEKEFEQKRAEAFEEYKKKNK